MCVLIVETDKVIVRIMLFIEFKKFCFVQWSEILRFLFDLSRERKRFVIAHTSVAIAV